MNGEKPIAWSEEQTAHILEALDRMIAEGEWAREVRDLLTGQQRRKPQMGKVVVPGPVPEQGGGAENEVQVQYQYNHQMYTKQIKPQENKP